MWTKQRFTLEPNNCISNDPCVICGQRCDPCGYDIMVDKALVCEDCCREYVPDLVRERDAWMRREQAAWEAEGVQSNQIGPRYAGDPSADSQS
jgi:hypothetical protein